MKCPVWDIPDVSEVIRRRQSRSQHSPIISTGNLAPFVGGRQSALPP